MAKERRVSIEYGYTLTINDDDTLELRVYTEDGDLLEVDGKNGILTEASDMEAWLSEESEEMTLEDVIYGSREFLKDWGVEHEVAEAIIKHLTPWFMRYTTEVWTVYAEADDMTFIMEGKNGNISVVGFYFGEPTAEDTKRFRGSTTAVVED